MCVSVTSRWRFRLDALVDMVNNVVDGSPSKKCHLERIEHDLAVQPVGHRPADDGAAEDVGDAGQVEEPFAGLDVLDVGDAAQKLGSTGKPRASARRSARTPAVKADRPRFAL